MKTSWKIKSQYVEAEQLTAQNVPACVEFDPGFRGGPPAYSAVTAFGRVLLPLGTWIVYDEEGARPVPQGIFERLFEPLSIKG